MILTHSLPCGGLSPAGVRLVEPAIVLNTLQKVNYCQYNIIHLEHNPTTQMLISCSIKTSTGIMHQFLLSVAINDLA